TTPQGPRRRAGPARTDPVARRSAIGVNLVGEDFRRPHRVDGPPARRDPPAGRRTGTVRAHRGISGGGSRFSRTQGDHRELRRTAWLPPLQERLMTAATIPGLNTASDTPP